MSPFKNHLRLFSTLVAFSFLNLYSSLGWTMLVITPPNQPVKPLFERLLLCFDPLSETQTLIGQAQIEGSPSSFAILIPTFPSAEIHYTTTSIWNSIQKVVPQRKRYARHLQINWTSFLIDSFIPKVGQTKLKKATRSILKAKKTQIHKSEQELHSWMLSKGFNLHPNQALAIKRAYQQGHVLFSIWVVPPKEQAHVASTWTSTWIFHTRTKTPHLWTLNEVQIHPLLSTPVPSFPTEITFLTEWPASVDLNDPSQLFSPHLNQHHLLSKFQSSKSPSFSIELSRQQVNQLNTTLRSTYWNFKRGGMLTHFKFDALPDLHQLAFKPTSSRNEIRPKIQTEKQIHHLTFPVELVFLGLFLLWWLWFRYAQRDPLF